MDESSWTRNPSAGVRLNRVLAATELRYLVSKGVVAVGADTWAVEAIPFEQGAGVFEVHQILLPMNGTYILENINTLELAKDKDVRIHVRVR
jgi:kynurenine formamidase